MKTLKSINPYTNKIIFEVPTHSENQMESMTSEAQKAFQTWKNVDISDRLSFAQNLSKLLKENCHELASIITNEMGKPILEARAEVMKSATICDYYLENAEDFLDDIKVKTEAHKSYVKHRPLGIILGVMPWNFPCWQVIRFAVPTLLAGNAVMVKHAGNVSQSALMIDSLIAQAELPKHLYQTVLCQSENIHYLINHSHIKGISLTGSTPVGKIVAELAAKNLKKTVFELGGSDPYIILEDADLAAAAKACVKSRFINSGQSCIAAKRIIVHKNIQEEFTKLVLARISQMTWGDPFDDNSDIGPMARLDLRDELHHQVTQSIEQGAELLHGGKIPKEAGAFYPPTLLTHITKDMPAFNQELFGPVMSIITAQSEAHAIELANETPFGLGAAIFTSNISKGQRIAEMELDAGSCFVNDFVRSDPRLPFGGTKESGLGRELGVHGLLEFTNTKTIYIK